MYLNSTILAQMYVSGTYNWFVCRVSFISCFMTIVCSVVCMLFRFSEDPILIAMTFTYVNQLKDLIQSLLVTCGECDKEMVSI